MLVLPPTSICEEDHMKNGFFSAGITVHNRRIEQRQRERVARLDRQIHQHLPIDRQLARGGVELQRHSAALNGDRFHSAAWLQGEVHRDVGARLHQHVLLHLLRESLQFGGNRVGPGSTTVEEISSVRSRLLASSRFRCRCSEGHLGSRRQSRPRNRSQCPAPWHDNPARRETTRIAHKR